MTNVTTGKTYYGRNGRKYTMDHFIKKGGEGEVYTISGYPDSVAKLYTARKFKSTKYIMDMRTYLKEKIETMLDYPVQTHLNGQLVITWPSDLLYDASGAFAGYVMPRVYAKKSLVSAIDSTMQKKLIPNYTWRTAAVIAYNLASAVDLIHERSYVIGDMNPLNFLVDSNGHITVIDTDSFNITNPRTNKTYKCTVARDELLPPELQGKDRSRPTTVFTQESDRFGLAVHIFTLLMNGAHPFGSVSTFQGSGPSTSNGSEMHNIVNGICPYVTGGSGKPSKLAPDVKILPQEVRSLFDRAFRYTAFEAARPSTAARRPKASEWISAMDHLVHADYSRHGSHVYLRSYGKCPWCDLENKKRILPGGSTALQLPVSIPKLSAPAPVSRVAKAVGNVTNTIRNPGGVAINVRRDDSLLHAACIAAGVLISPLLANSVIPLIGRFCGWWLPAGYVIFALSLCGGLCGWGAAYLASKRYVNAYNGAPWLLLALLSPVLAWIAVFSGALLMKLLWLLLLAVFEIVKWTLITLLILGICALVL